MNWIIRHSKKMLYHTHLEDVLKPIINDIRNYNWLISDVEHGGSLIKLPINMDDEYFILSPTQFNELLDADVQLVWGIVLGIPNNINIKIKEDNIPFAESNNNLFEDGHIQHPEAQIEIICFDSSYTIVKFTNEVLSNKFREYFDDAIELATFRKKYGS